MAIKQKIYAELLKKEEEVTEEEENEDYVKL
jgi:hypothetical protein